ncbi:MAG: hydroxyacylglutathione hydrolase [Cyanobacteria bacterium]|nr:hydroxyacylglutathione hydrolase [Cyanobacteriota bacterium]
MQIYRLDALWDNYIFLLHDPESQTAAVVDPAELEPVMDKLRVLGARLTAIFNTHHHGDHVGANQALIEQYPDLVVYGGEGDRGRIPGQQVYLSDGDMVSFGGRAAQVFFVPGHTRAHIAYYFPPMGAEPWGELFCGDTLFAGGCGRLFEGTPAQMVDSLGKLRALPDQTRVWCAHEYTLSNLKFARTVDGDNPILIERLAEVETARRHHQATVPATLGLEKQTNPFLRWDQPALQATAHSAEPVQTFATIRAMKDRF